MTDAKNPQRSPANDDSLFDWMTKTFERAESVFSTEHPGTIAHIPLSDGRTLSFRKHGTAYRLMLHRPSESRPDSVTHGSIAERVEALENLPAMVLALVRARRSLQRRAEDALRCAGSLLDGMEAVRTPATPQGTP